MSLYDGRKPLARLLQLSRQVTKQELVVTLVLLSTALFTSSCSSVSGASSPTSSSQGTPSDVRVQVSPASAQISPGASLQFTATISGTSSVGVVWTTSGGTISSTGLFTAPTSVAPVTVTAVSIANSGAKASATITFGASSKLAIVSTALPTSQTGAPYNASLTASGGTPPYQWSLFSGSLPQGLSLVGDSITGTPVQVGNSSLTLKVTDAAANSATASFSLQVTANTGLNYTGYDGPAQLPLVYLQTSMADTPAPGAIVPVNAGADLQTALNNANCGDTLQLQAGAVFSGRFELPAKSCDDQHWIIIRTSSPDSALPPEGTRMNPCYAGVASLPGRPAFTCPVLKNVLAQILYTVPGMPGALYFLPGANHYRFIGLEITRDLPTVHMWNLVAANETADKIIFDRVWMHGTATDETKGAVHLSGITNTAIVDSYFSDFHCISKHGSCIDSQDVNGGDGTLPGGPYKIDNNFLEAAGESIMFGGGPGTTTPADIEIRYNHLFKPAQWQPGVPGFVGGYTGDPFIVKNNFELKNGQRILLEGNIFENVWGGFTQHGFSVLIDPATQNGGCIPCQDTDITFRYNVITNTAGGFGIGNGKGKSGGYAAAGERYSIHDNLIENVNKVQYDGYGLFMLMTSPSTTEVLSNVSIRHNTAFPDPASHVLSILNPVSQMPGFVFENNLIATPPNPFVSAGGGPQNCAASDSPLLSLNTCFKAYVFTGNLFAGDLPKYPSNDWPSGQIFVNSVNSVGFVDYATGNYALAPSSPYKGQGTDGLDPGADITGLNSATAGVE